MFVVATWATARPVAADQHYTVTGNDIYHIGVALPATRIAYAGTELLTVVRDGPNAEYRALVSYTKTDSNGTIGMHASFVQILLPDGSFTDSNDADPDFLTVLNQPFAVTLDPVTLRAIEHLRGKVPFQANSPLGHSTLVGFLRPDVRGLVDGRPVVGVAFEANGPMVGGLPQNSTTVVAGSIRMDGTAYYATRNALLLALNARLTITGTLQNGGKTVPVRIVYRRSIRAYSKARPRSKSGDQLHFQRMTKW